MITTITPSVAAIASADVSALTVVVPLLTLIILLIQKEVTGLLPDPRATLFSRVLDVAVVPLLGACLVTVFLGLRTVLS